MIYLTRDIESTRSHLFRLFDVGSITKSDAFKITYLVSLAFVFGFRVAPLFHPSMLWAEDSSVLYGPSISPLNHKINSGLLSTYAGQNFFLNIALAKIILFLIHFNYSMLPTVSTLVSVVLVPVFASNWLRKNVLFQQNIFNFLVFGYILLSPDSYEPLGNLANVATYLLFCCIPIVGFSKPKSRSSYAFELSLILAASFTGGIAIILFFIIFLRKYLTGYYSRVQTALIICAVFYQAQGWLTRGSTKINIIHTFKEVFLILIKRVGAETFLGQMESGRIDSKISIFLWSSIGILALTCLLLPAALTIKSSGRIPAKAMIVAGSLFLVYFCMFVFSNLKTGIGNVLDFSYEGRHLIILHLLLFILSLTILELALLSKDKISITLISAFLVIVALGVFFDFSLQSKSPAVFADYWKNFADCVAANSHYCYTRIAPGGDPGWGMAWTSSS